jgi:Pyruvate/2-oxoacid:ferredoxin oxidoreductase delta subunit
MKPVIDKRRCPALEAVCLAIPACPTGAIAYVEDDDEPLGGRIVIDYTLCDECGTCADECCGEAIEMRDISLSGATPAS